MDGNQPRVSSERPLERLSDPLATVFRVVSRCGFTPGHDTLSPKASDHMQDVRSVYTNAAKRRLYIRFYFALDDPSGHLGADRRGVATGVCASDALMHNLAFCIKAGALPRTLARWLRRREITSALRISAVGGLCLTVPKNSLII